MNEPKTIEQMVSENTALLNKAHENIKEAARILPLAQNEAMNTGLQKATLWLMQNGHKAAAIDLTDNLSEARAIDVESTMKSMKEIEV